MNTIRLSLDVSSPADVAGVLRRAAERYRELGDNLADAHPDDWAAARASEFWTALSAVLDRAAAGADKAGKRCGF